MLWWVGIRLIIIKLNCKCSSVTYNLLASLILINFLIASKHLPNIINYRTTVAVAADQTYHHLLSNIGVMKSTFLEPRPHVQEGMKCGCCDVSQEITHPRTCPSSWNLSTTGHTPKMTERKCFVVPPEQTTRISPNHHHCAVCLWQTFFYGEAVRLDIFFVLLTKKILSSSW